MKLGHSICSPFLCGRVAKKDTFKRSGIKFVPLRSVSVNKHSGPKDTKWKMYTDSRMRKKLLEFLEGCDKRYDPTRHSINKVYDCQNGVTSKLWGHVRGKQQGTCNFKNMSIFPFCNPVLLRGVNVRTLMYNTIFFLDRCSMSDWNTQYHFQYEEFEFWCETEFVS